MSKDLTSMSKNEIKELLKSEEGVTITTDEERKAVLHACGLLTDDEIILRRNLILGCLALVVALWGIKLFI